MANTVLGYKFEMCNPKILTIPYIKEHIDELDIKEITLDGCTLINENKFIYSDYEHPIVLVDAILSTKTLSIDSKYYMEHKEEIDELIAFICQHIKGDFLSLADKPLVNDNVYEAIGSNPNIKKLRVGNMNDPVSLTLNGYNSLKKGNIEEVRSYGICEELKENFDPIILYNRRELAGRYTYNALQSSDSFLFSKSLSEDELYYLKFINKKASISIQSYDYANYFKMVKRLKEVNYEGPISLYVNNKNELNNYIFTHLEELTGLDNIFIKSQTYIGLDCDILTYIKNEKRLIDMVMPAINYSPFEKYLYAYNIVKHFKKYKESEDKSKARNLYQLLDSDYMVCVGFARLLGDLLEKLGIPSIDYSVSVDVGLDDVDSKALVVPDKVVSRVNGQEHEVLLKKESHARLMVNLVDSKYGIDGYFITDPTWDNNMELDTYNYALMTQDEYIGIYRYDSLNYFSVDELFFAHSLEEFYLKINFLLDKNKRQSEKDIIRNLLNKFKKIDSEFYEELISKYEGLDKYSFTFTKELIQDILLDMGEHILLKTNKMVSGKTFKEGIRNYYEKVDGLNGEELEQKVNEVMRENERLQAINFPTRYKIERDNEKMVILNETNKFTLDSEEEGLKM